MESPHGLTAILLCCSLCLPSPLLAAQQAADPSQPPAKAKSRQNDTSGQLRGDERILQALNRFTFGPKPGDLEAVRTMGLDNWFDQQLRPGAIDETELTARLAQFPAMQWSMQDLFFRLPSNPIIRQAAQGKVDIPQGGTLQAVYENQIYRIQARKTAKAEKGTVAENQTPGLANGPVNQSMNAEAGTETNGGMAQNQQATAPDAMAQPGTGSAGATPAPEMNAMTPAPPAANSNQAPAAAPAPTPADEARIQRILALPPQQRVMRLQSMQPEDFENFMKSLRPVQRQALLAGMSPDLKEAVGALENPEQTTAQELFAQRLTRDIYANAQLQEVMTDFWLNHFNVYLRKNEQMPYYLVSYERDVIRPRALGKFEDLLEAVAHSPAMMLYLDNAESMGPDSPAAERAKIAAARRPDAKKKADAGLNENYARELMELHTLGVNGGYTQADVTQVARVLTGWTVDKPQYGGDFIYAPQRHEPGTKTVMGNKIKENGEMEGQELLHMLAMRPATAQFISRKLAIRFVSDDPPQALVDRMAKAYLASGGDIPTVLKALFHSPELWAANDYRAKVKTPLEFVVSAVRASNANVENFQPLVNQLRQMGMPLYGCMPPTGYKWDEADWVSTGALVDRMNFALSLAANRLPGITVVWAPELDMSTLDSDAPAQQVIPTSESEETRLEPMLIPGGVSDATRTAALEQFKVQSAQNATAATPVVARRPNRAPAADQYEREDQLLAGLLMGSPEFQRR
ncbi:MAG: DUF1800 domain-containing protein [Terracidiphilus sp.]|jgi:uncharacterized protein (DUF1800 family)